VVLEHLVAEGHEVEIMASGRATEFLGQRFAGVNRIHGYHMIYEENRVRRGKTLWSNVLTGAVGTPKNIAAYFDLIKEAFAPRLVISDFESWTYLYAKVHGLPIVSIDNMQIINRCTHPPEIIAGLLFANSIHCIDLLRYFGGDIEHISATASQWDEEQKNSFSALIKFQNGATGHYIAHWMSPASWAVVLYGMGRRVSLNPLERATLIDADRSEKLLPVDEVDVKFKPGLYGQNRFFLDAVKERRPIGYPGSDLADAVKTMQLIDAISGGTTW